MGQNLGQLCDVDEGIPSDIHTFYTQWNVCFNRCDSIFLGHENSMLY